MPGRSYGEHFYDFMEQRLREGGEPDYMVSVARIYSGKDKGDLRDYAFYEWLRDADFSSVECGTGFCQDDHLDVHDSYLRDVLCPRCRKARYE